MRRAEVHGHLRRGDVVEVTPSQADVVRQQRTLTAAQFADDRADRRTNRRRQKSCVRSGREGRVNLLHLVVALSECQVANDRELIGDRRLQRHVLADLQSRKICGDRSELAAVFDGRVGLHVIHVDVTRTSGQTDENDRLRNACRRPRFSPQSQQVCQSKATQSHRAHFEKVAASHSITERRPRTGESQHDKALVKNGTRRVTGGRSGTRPPS